MKVLIIGFPNSIILNNLVKYIVESDATIQLDYYGTVIPECKQYFSDIIIRKRHFPGWIYNIPKIRALFFLVDTILTFKALPYQYYDAINIHYIFTEHVILLFILDRVTKKLILTPWGSDVYRISKFQAALAKRLYKRADYVTGLKTKFRNDFVKKFEVQNYRLVDVGLGSDMIDFILSHPGIKRNEAKIMLGIEGKFAITCGYNGRPAQNHGQVIDAMIKISKFLPSNTILLLPMTYGANLEYVKLIKKSLISNHIDYIIFDSFLGEMDLFYVRKASDIFINAQTTDAYSASVQEYLLCGTKVINASWLRYTNLEEDGLPYFIFDSFESLPDILVKAVNDSEFAISPVSLSVIEQSAWRNQIPGWLKLYHQCAEE